MRGGHQNELLRDLCHEKPERLKVVGLLEVHQNLERRERERLRGIYHGPSRSMDHLLDNRTPSAASAGRSSSASRHSGSHVSTSYRLVTGKPGGRTRSKRSSNS